jgi:hypothetical protein
MFLDWLVAAGEDGWDADSLGDRSAGLSNAPQLTEGRSRVADA